MKRFLFVMLMSWLTIVNAAEPKCIEVPFKTDGKNIILPGTPDPKSPLVYFFKNKSLQSLWLDHPEQASKSMSAGWASYIRADRWSAIVINKKNFSLSCSMIQPGKVETLDCSKTLYICSPQNLKSAAPLSGNYWLAEDKRWENFVKGFSYRGISFE